MAELENFTDAQRTYRNGVYASPFENAGSSSQGQIRLDLPRPGVLRSRNEYVDVTKLPTRSHRRKKHRRSTSRRRVSNDGNQISQNRFASDAGKAGKWPRDNSQNLRHCGSGMVASTSAIEKAVESISRPVMDSTPATFQSPSIPPGRVVRVVATANARKGCDSSTYSVITKQPTKISGVTSAADFSTGRRQPTPISSPSLLDASGSIICKRCGRCRCAECVQPKQLPSRLICGNHCLLSPESVVDAVSCMCCVKSCLYHTRGHVYEDCGTYDYYEDGVTCDCNSSCASLAMGRGICGSHSLWSCSRKSPDRCFRWTVLTSAFLCLPCLWLYLPLKTCSIGVEAAYVHCYDNGCRCEQRSESNDRLISRRRNRRSRTLPPELPSITAAKRSTSAASPCDLRPLGSKTARRYSLVGEKTT